MLSGALAARPFTRAVAASALPLRRLPSLTAHASRVSAAVPAWTTRASFSVLSRSQQAAATGEMKPYTAEKFPYLKRNQAFKKVNRSDLLGSMDSPLSIYLLKYPKKKKRTTSV